MLGNSENYLELNKSTWNRKAPVHLLSDFYEVDSFLNGVSSLNEIELALLGDVQGKNILHLQCHFGQDTLSLVRIGAVATGLDFSSAAIKIAEELAQKMELKATFICEDVYNTPATFHNQFDIVFTSYGTIGWLPDLDRWAEVISKCLKQGGKLVFVEFHPVVWMFDNDFEGVAYHYFKDEAIVETETGTYADRENDEFYTTISWNHSLGEVFRALLSKGLQIKFFDEYDYSPYNCFSGMKEVSKGKYRIAKFDDKIPLVYSLVAEKI